MDPRQNHSGMTICLKTFLVLIFQEITLLSNLGNWIDNAEFLVLISYLLQKSLSSPNVLSVDMIFEMVITGFPIRNVSGMTGSGVLRKAHEFIKGAMT